MWGKVSLHPLNNVELNKLRLPDLRLHDLGTAVKVKAKSWQKGARRHFWLIFPVSQVLQVSQVMNRVISPSQIEP